MPRKRRRENRGLPARWTIHHGAYFYYVPRGQESQWDGKRLFRLGSTLVEAYQTWTAHLRDTIAPASTVGQLLDRYALEVVPTKAPKTQNGNVAAIKRLKGVAGHIALAEFRPAHAYQYLDRRGREGRTAAKREIEVLSHAFTKAIEWGLIDAHPIVGKVRKPGTPPRDRYVEDWEVLAALSLPARRRSGSVAMVQAYIRLKLLTGLRRGDLLRLRISDLLEDGIHVRPRKTAKTTGKRLVIVWDEAGALRGAVEDAKALRPVDIAPWLFCNRRGEPYVTEAGSADGWDSIWQRFMARVLAETDVKQRFTEHDLRAKCASDAESLAHAQQLLSHADSATTKRIYRRRPERVRPGKGI